MAGTPISVNPETTEKLLSPNLCNFYISQFQHIPLDHIMMNCSILSGHQAFDAEYVTKKINILHDFISEEIDDIYYEYLEDQKFGEQEENNRYSFDELEQKRILVFINQLSDEELKIRGKDMAVSFSFLGMDLIVTRICLRLIPLLSDVKEQISLGYIFAD
jgi:hypothetical protein